MQWGRLIGVVAPVVIIAVFFGLVARMNRGDRPDRAAEVVAEVDTAAPEEPKVSGPAVTDPKGADWWEGKEDLRRRIERNRYFAADPPESSFESEEERLEARREFVFEEFIAWLKRYQGKTDPAERAALVPEGVIRATIRQQELRAMQMGDGGKNGAPFAFEIPPALRESMPPEVREIVMREGG